jgi:hypothetical protein
MRERPILFRGELVREILAGRKTVTRRPVKELRVRLRHEVESDLPDALPRSAAGPGVYAAELNPQGAVAVRTSTGRPLGVKPAEFDFLCPYVEGHTYLRKYSDGRALWHLQPAGEQRLWVRETFARVPRTAYWHDPSIPHRERGDEWAIYREGWERSAPSWKPSIHMPRWASRLELEVLEVRVERLHALDADEVADEGMPSRAAFLATWDAMYRGGQFAAERNPWVWVVSFRRADAARSAA